jgi:hypothetical protein
MHHAHFRTVCHARFPVILTMIANAAAIGELAVCDERGGKGLSY